MGTLRSAISKYKVFSHRIKIYALLIIDLLYMRYFINNYNSKKNVINMLIFGYICLV